MTTWVLTAWYGDACHPQVLARDPGWASLRDRWLACHPGCAICDVRRGAVPHHKRPVHLYPGQELDDGNLVTLCPVCHLLVGHLKSWSSYNPSIDADVIAWRKKILARPF